MSSLRPASSRYEMKRHQVAETQPPPCQSGTQPCCAPNPHPPKCGETSSQNGGWTHLGGGTEPNLPPPPHVTYEEQRVRSALPRCRHWPYDCFPNREKQYWCDLCIRTRLFPDAPNPCSSSSPSKPCPFPSAPYHTPTYVFPPPPSPPVRNETHYHTHTTTLCSPSPPQGGGGGGCVAECLSSCPSSCPSSGPTNR